MLARAQSPFQKLKIWQWWSNISNFFNSVQFCLISLFWSKDFIWDCRLELKWSKYGKKFATEITTKIVTLKFQNSYTCPSITTCAGCCTMH